jgi:integrase
MGRRRGRGEGYVEQLPSGSWRAVVSLGVDRATGKRRRLTTTRRTKPLARAWLHDRLADLGKGGLGDCGLTVAAWCSRWLEQKGQQVQPRSLLGYAADVHKRIVPHLGAVPLVKLRQGAIADWYVGMSKAGESATSCHKAGSTLRRALTDAQRQGLVASNPALLVRRPRMDERNVAVWAVEQVARFREHIRGHQLESLFVLALDTGMRKGELLALDWSQIDAGGESVQVTHSLEQGTKRRKEVKTKQSRRRIGLSDAGREAVRRPQPSVVGPVFADDAGDWLGSHSVNDMFNEAVRAAGVPRIRFHDLRHTHATLALAAGASIRSVSARLGHANPAFTLRCYAHAMPDGDERIAEIWGGILASRAGDAVDTTPDPCLRDKPII